MASPVSRLTLTLKNNAGLIAKVTVLVAAAVIDPSGAAVSAIKTAIDAITAMAGKKATISQEASVTHGFTAGPFATVEDRIAFLFEDSDGDTNQLHILGPRVTTAGGGVFLADGITVDLTNADIANYIGVIVADAETEAGVPYTQCNFASRFRAKTQKG